MKKTDDIRHGALRRGFTIIELLVVISIIAILATLVTRAALSAIKEGREKEARIMAQSIKLGIANFHAQHGQWPGEIEKYAESGKSPNGTPGHHGALSRDEASDAIKEVIEESGKGNPLLDASGLFVASKRAAAAKHGHGLKYGDARRQGVGLGDMVFGYQRKRDGEFRAFLVKYDPTNDTVSVERPEE